MKKTILIALLIGSCQWAIAQKVDYKKNIISVDNVEIGKVVVQKGNFGLTKNFDFFSNSGEKLIIAALSTEFEADKSDNSTLYYRFTFLPTNQVGIFRLSALSMEKGFVNLIGKSGIVNGNNLNEAKIIELIAQKGVTPKVALDYTIVSRNTSWPIQLKDDKQIEQDHKNIGWFKPAGQRNGQDFYEYFLPSGILIAKVNFAGGNNAQNFELFTPKDNQKRIINIKQAETIKFSANTVDPNYHTLKRITAVLVERGYL